MPEGAQFAFEISLSVLNHLGRHLYRSFATVLGEAISNAWDADANNVWITIDRENNSFFIKDDGAGMSAADFQNKFLRIGYSKRKDGDRSTEKKRAYIGRKGIGKLALLSCADRISIISKTAGGAYIGGVIDNSGLDKAIQNDLTPDKYTLEAADLKAFAPYVEDHQHGTIIYFQNAKDGIRNTVEYLRRLMALYFRFALMDDAFHIFLNDKEITLDDLQNLADKTEFLWNINKLEDVYVNQRLTKLKESKGIEINADFSGFIGSVIKPRDLKIMTTSEKVSIDLFVNGRMRERDILKHIPTARIVESYLYGQIHFNSLDDNIDRFTTSREGIVADDPKFQAFLDAFRKVMTNVLEDWDKWRRKHKEDGDPDDPSISQKERKAGELFNAVSEEYGLMDGSPNKAKVDGWVTDLGSDASYNFASYAECFVSENLVRRFIADRGLALSPEATALATEMRRRETQNKQRGNVIVDIRSVDADANYLDMTALSTLVDRNGALDADARTYRPIRDALMHTSLLTGDAKRRLTSIFDNVRARVRVLLS